MWTKWKGFEEAFLLNKQFRLRTIDLLNERLREITTKELDYNSFGSPSWPYLQAALVGARKEIELMKQLFSDPKDNK